MYFGIPPSVKIFICTVPADMRKAFDGLAAMTTDVIGDDPLSGHLFVFCNRRKDRVKILYWDRSGYCLWCKRLEAGIFRIPDDETLMRMEVESSELYLLLAGIELDSAKRSKRYQRV